MGRTIDLAEGDGQLLREIYEDCGLSQKELARIAGVKQSWLSNVVTGNRREVDHDMIEKVASNLVPVVIRSLAEGKLHEDRGPIALALLSRLTPAAAAVVPQRVYRPGSRLPDNAAHFVRRPEEKTVMDLLLGNRPFAVCISGPVQCGKTGLLARLESKAKEKGTETAWFDPRSVTGREVEANVARGLAEQLQIQWGLDEPKGSSPDSIVKLHHWLTRALTPTASRPRLLVMDDLARLGTDSVELWLNGFVRKIVNDQDFGPQVSVAIGVAYCFGPRFEQWLYQVSSAVSWSPPKIDLGWFTPTEVEEMEVPTGREQRMTRPGDERGAAGGPSDLFTIVGGQPYLTHAAMFDNGFREAMLVWKRARGETATHARSSVAPSLREDSNKQIRESEWYKKHLKAIKLNLFGPMLKPDSQGIEDVLKAFVDISLGKHRTLTHEQSLYLRQSRLLVDDANGRRAAMPLYVLVAEDLQRYFAHGKGRN